ncbi:hypothetical protein LSM04_009085 [Trypanosoma melophagium]|uniref:uncharacterized protein n=1 Tax=Trypanosoma melophagium TaxID=715481 RepID=UPI00351A7660|nr:hypothetical protein LSM04_009085 [Trypanosoma melophagium]
MVARMPYEVVDVWYGCFSMRRRSLPENTAVLGSFMPREPHEVYVIGIIDVPHDLIGNEETCRYFLNYLETVPVCSEDVEKSAFTAVGCALRINEVSMCIILLNVKPTNCPASMRARSMRMLMGSLPFGDTLIDIEARFDYLMVFGAFNFGADFRENDMLLAQIKTLNLMSDMVEAPPSFALVNSPEPIRIFYATRPRVSRLDIKQYTTSRALIMPNAFVSMDIYSQGGFLSVFGEKVHRVQLILDKLILSLPGRRILPVYFSELRISDEWIENSPLFASIHKNGDEYTLSGREVPRVVPTVSSIDFLRLQTISFSLMGSHDPKPKKNK